MRTVVILVPGICGSELRTKSSNALVWPGSIIDYIGPYKNFDALMSDDIYASSLIEKFAFLPQYSALISNLGLCGFSSGNGTLELCPYDWRLGNEASAEVLARVIERVVSADDDVEIFLIGHSMGGLVCRFFLESGQFDRRPGFTSVVQLLALATPHLGSPIALAAAQGQRKQLFLNSEQVKTLANDPRFPSLYQLLPPKTTPFLWNSATGGGFGEINLFAQGAASQFGLLAENLESASQFQNALSLLKKPQRVRYFFFAGNSQPTATHATCLMAETTSKVRIIDTDHGGDGTVPLWSGMIAGIQGQYVSGEHGTIYRSHDLLITLAALLGKPGLLSAATMPTLEIAVRDRVVQPRESVFVSLNLLKPVPELNGELVVKELRISPVDSSSGGKLRVVIRIPISYKGASLDQLNVVFDSPGQPSAYSIEFVESEALDVLASDEFFVQQDE